MLTTKQDYFETEAGMEVLEQLDAICTSDKYVTEHSYSPHSENLISFLEKHKEFIRKHPNTDPFQYVSNLKIMCRLR